MTLEGWHGFFAFLTERTANVGLAIHFILFLGMPFMVFEYVADRLLGGTSKPPLDNGMVLLSIPEHDWQGFFWMMNFYGALIIGVIILWLLYILWDRAFKKDKLVSLMSKAFMCMAVAFGVPLKLVYRYAIMVPQDYAPDLNYLGVLDITEIARASYFSFEGGWFFTRFAVLPPIFLLVTYILQQAIEKRSAKAKGKR
jgi:hypothetical protein